MEQLISATEDTYKALEEQILKGKDLLKQGHDRQDELHDLLAKLDVLREQAENDVELTKATLKDANEIYKTLKGNLICLILIEYFYLFLIC